MANRIIPIDFSEVPSSAPIEEGEYPVVVEKVEVRASQTSETPYLNWTMRITEGPQSQRLLYMMTSVSGKALWKLREVLEALGAFHDQMQLEIEPESKLLVQPRVTGLACIAVVTSEEYQGQKRARVNKIKPIDTDGDADLESMPAFE